MKIPRDLKPGDRLYYADGTYATVASRDEAYSPYFRGDARDRKRGRICARLANKDYVNIWCDTGGNFYDDKSPIVRFERITSVQQKAKRKALVKLAVSGDTKGFMSAVERAQQVGGSHYKDRRIQPWDIILEYGLDYWEGNALKYILRRKTDRLEDLKKARHYLDECIRQREGKS